MLLEDESKVRDWMCCNIGYYWDSYYDLADSAYAYFGLDPTSMSQEEKEEYEMLARETIQGSYV
jgi:hypothetical protein